jgi:hypothetical protein
LSWKLLLLISRSTPPPQNLQRSTGGSENFWIASKTSPHFEHLYS